MMMTIMTMIMIVIMIIIIIIIMSFSRIESDGTVVFAYLQLFGL